MTNAAKPIAMKIFLFSIALLATSQSYSQKAIHLHDAAKSKEIEVYNREMTLLDEKSGIRLSKAEGEGVAWLQGIEFSDGIIEFDVRGEDLKQHSFVGIAFHGKDNETFDAIYLRPFQFKSNDDVLRSRSIQYISLPDFPWRTLREKSPGKYENAIDPSPDPNSWVRVKIIVKGTQISTYINGNKQASLVVEKATRLDHGRIGFYVADTSGGDFANITITKTD